MWHSIENLRKHIELYRKLQETCGTLKKTRGNMWHSIENLRKHVALEETCDTLKKT